MTTKEKARVIGKRIPRVDAAAKVAGAAKFYDDLKLPGMLYGKILRSPHPHAKILKMDTSKAKKLPGVKAVITAADIPKKKFGLYGHLIPAYEDKLPLEDEKVRVMGDEVAAVAAVSEEVAEAALDLIKVDYKPLPPVMDPEEAMKLGAQLVHEEKGSNIISEYHWNLGDVEGGFKEADYVFEDKFVTSQHAHTCPETHGCVANWDASGRLTVWIGTQHPYPHRMQIARALNIPVGKVRVVNMYVGGAYGSKYEMHAHEPVAAHLSRITGRPVKITLSREEEFVATRTRHPEVIKIKTGVKKDGTITARHIVVILDKGAYIGQGEGVITDSGWGYTAVYKGAVKFDGYMVYTNKPYGGAFRGYGLPQTTFALDSQLDIIAEKLGMDPVELRLKNAYRKGDVTVSNTGFPSCGLSECIEKAAEAIGWKEKKKRKIPNHGVGIAAGICYTGATGFYWGEKGRGDPESAVIALSEDGTFNLLLAGSDMGQGYYTAMLQIAAEELGVPYENVRIVSGDTDATSLGIGAYADRQTFICGNAVRLAAIDAKREMMKVVADKLEVSPDNLVAEGERIFVKDDPERGMTVAEAARHCIVDRGTPIVGKGVYNPDSTLFDIATGKMESAPGFCPTYGFEAQAVEVEVDPETLQVKVLKVASAHDCGRVINLSMAEAQVEGGLCQSLGYALVEGLRYDRDGRCVNPTLTDYRILGAPDVPEVIPIFVETMDPKGPFGAKGLAEQMMIPTAAAVANAVYDAIGVRVKELPITPEKLFQELGVKKK